MACVSAWSAPYNASAGESVAGGTHDVQAPATLYAGTDNGVFKSTDSGRRWRAVNAGLAARPVHTLAIHPRRPATVYAAPFYDPLSDNPPRGVFRTTDGGRSWRAVNSGLRDKGVYELAIDPQTPDTVYAGTEKGIFKTRDGGRSWRPVNAGLGQQLVEALAIDPQKPSILYVGTEGSGVFKTADGGQSWSAANAGVRRKGVWSLAIDPQRPRTVYAGTDQGVFRSTDGGRSWGAVKAGFGSKDVWTLAIDPRRPTTIYAGTDAGGIYGVPEISSSACLKSTNQGRRWRPANAGLTAGYLSALAIDPRRPTNVYAGTDRGVFRSTDGGRSWRAVNAGLGRTSVEALAIDP